MNVLLTSVGRRNYLVEYFKEVLKPYNGKVFATNSDLHSAALWQADSFEKSPLIYDKDYEGFILDYCLKNEIAILISLFDIELPVLSKLKEKFLEQGILIVVADEWFTVIANDKWKTQAFLKENNFDTVPAFLNVHDFRKSYFEKRITFPVYIKPRWGMGSMAVYKADNMEEVSFYFRKTKKEIESSYLKYESYNDLNNAVMIQATLPGVEYGLDVINDLKGNYCCTVVKKKIAMRSGETDVAITVDEPVLEALGKRLAALSKHPANMDVDVFFDGKNAYVLEFNSRFGGGYPFSHQAGINLPKAIVKWHLNEEFSMEELLKPTIGVKSMKGITLVQQQK